MNEEFKDLFVNESQPLDKELLSKTLKPFIQLTEKGDISFKEEFFHLTPKEKIVVYILVKKVLKEAKIIDEEMIGVKVISDYTGIAYGTVGRNLRELVKEGILKQDKNKYYFPNYSLFKVKDWFVLSVPEAK
jgi:DNA-binding MarR family transcriptional regulator